MYTSQLSVLAVPGRKVLLIPEILCPMMQAGPKKWQERLISALRHLIICLPDKTAGTWKIGKIIFLICCLLFASLLCPWCHLIDTWCWNPAMSCLRKTFRHWFDSRQGYVKGCLLWTPFKLNSRNYAGDFLFIVGSCRQIISLEMVNRRRENEVSIRIRGRRSSLNRDGSNSLHSLYHHLLRTSTYIRCWHQVRAKKAVSCEWELWKGESVWVNRKGRQSTKHLKSIEINQRKVHSSV